MATSRPIRRGEWLTDIRRGSPFLGSNDRASGQENPDGYVLQSDFGLEDLVGDEYWNTMCERVFGTHDGGMETAITNGTAPGLYVREGDDTSDWETYRQVLARRVEEAMAARRGGAGGGETATAATRQDDEIRVGDVVEVVSCNGSQTIAADIGRGGRVSHIAHGVVYVASVDGMRLPIDNTASLADVRKVSSPSPQTVAVNVSPMPDGEAARIEAAVSDEVRRRISSPMVSSSDETTRQRVVSPVPPTDGVYIGPATIRFDDRAFTGIITATGSLRRGEPPVGSSVTAPSPPTTASPPPTPSRFSLLEVDLPPEPTSSNSRSLDADLAALQEELRVERERNRAQAAVQMQKSRFDLLECDLPAVPVAAAPVAAVAVKASPRPVVSSPPPKHRNPVETITDLTTARSPLELARILEGLNDELSTMMRQREAN